MSRAQVTKGCENSTVLAREQYGWWVRNQSILKAGIDSVTLSLNMRRKSDAQWGRKHFATPQGTLGQFSVLLLFLLHLTVQ